MREAILTNKSFSSVPETEKHAAWFEKFKDEYEFNEENTEDILKAEIGKTFVRVLQDAGVFKDTAEGRKYFSKFIDYVNNN
jgi:UDPglucose--hexose-1-phosphate uridylyltransferase